MNGSQDQLVCVKIGIFLAKNHPSFCADSILTLESIQRFINMHYQHVVGVEFYKGMPFAEVEQMLLLAQQWKDNSTVAR